MKRIDFLKILAFTSLTGKAMKIQALDQLTELPTTDPFPVLFLGHGSPMNAIEENDFVRGFRTVGDQIPQPKAILCISAHWETNGSMVTAMENPRTIHDFGGFPKELYDVQYPAPGSPELAREIQKTVLSTHIELDHQWGLDHGTWSVIKHLYPKAEIPVLQLSLDRTKGPEYHYQLAQQIASLRNKGILIVGSGNMIHNLRMVAWNKISGEPYAFDWAIEANEKMKNWITDQNHKELIAYHKHGKSFELAIPTPEHYLPLIYTLGLSTVKDDIQFFNDQPVGGSLSMTSVIFG
jgi:4,5-DOPA dioxygenase extradiol